MRRQLVYLAMPYSYTSKSKEIGANKPDFSEKDREIREKRFEIGNKVAAKLFLSRIDVFSPISMTHPIDKYIPEEKSTYGLWLPFDFSMILKCDAVYVLCISGWRESDGVAQEIKVATENNIPVVYIDEYLQILEV